MRIGPYGNILVYYNAKGHVILRQFRSLTGSPILITLKAPYYLPGTYLNGIMLGLITYIYYS